MCVRARVRVRGSRGGVWEGGWHLGGDVLEHRVLAHLSSISFETSILFLFLSLSLFATAALPPLPPPLVLRQPRPRSRCAAAAALGSGSLGPRAWGTARGRPAPAPGPGKPGRFPDPARLKLPVTAQSRDRAP